MFVDFVKIKIKAGKGGDGAVSFRREKYVAAGGPDGGDGANGGNIFLHADTNLSTLMDFRYQRKFAAQNGENGGAKKCFGKRGEDLYIRVPLGTLVKEIGTDRVLADVSTLEPIMVAKGGRGGWGNQHFATPTRQAPRFAKPGLPGQEFDISLELKLLADVGLAGFPNVGKSTLISMVSAAKPKIANYPFTTLIPNLGVVEMSDGNSFVMADIPGLIEGASDGVGLGHDFLRHIERCRVLVHVVDVSGLEGRDPIQDFETICNEIKRYNPELLLLPQLVAANKIDIATAENIAALEEYSKAKGLPFFAISAATRQGVDALINTLGALLDTLPPIKEYEIDPEPTKTEDSFDPHVDYNITIEDLVYVVDAPWLKHVLRGVDMEDYSSLQYFQRTLQQSGIIDTLTEMGIKDGDTVRIFDFEFDYLS